MISNKDIANKIKNLRISNNLSQERFGKKIGISGKSVCAYEKGKIRPSSKVMESISIIYGENIVNLIDQKKVIETISELKYKIIELESYIKGSNILKDT